MSNVLPFTIDSLEQLISMHIGVVGAGKTGQSFVRMLTYLGATVSVIDKDYQAAHTLYEQYINDINDRRSTADASDANRHNKACTINVLPWNREAVECCDIFMVSPGINPRSEIFSPHIPVWGDYELAWYLNEWEVCGSRRPWIAITGTNGKTTTTQMCEAILRAGGKRVIAAGNIGTPILDIVREIESVDYLLAEVSSFQLHYAPSFRPDIGVLLNIAPDHIDWHGSMENYAYCKNQVLAGGSGIIVIDDPGMRYVQPQGCRVIEITRDHPGLSQYGIDAEHNLIDNRGASAGESAVVLASCEQITPCTPAGWIDALAASAVARECGVDATTIATALNHFRPGAHRGETIAHTESIIAVDNSKATNPHAAIQAIGDVHVVYPQHHCILLMGGQLKNADITSLVELCRTSVSVVIIFGQDYAQICEAFLQHTSNIPVICIRSRDDYKDNLNSKHASHGASVSCYIEEVRSGTEVRVDQIVHEHSGLTELLVPLTQWNGATVMEVAVRAALEQACIYSPTVILLAPAAASLDMFTGYVQRGEMFTDAIVRLLA